MITASNLQYSQNWSDASGPNPGAFGHDEGVANDLATAGNMSEVISEKPKPQIPQKKVGLDELIRLRKELDDMRYEKEVAEELKSMMEDDLIKAQEEAEQKDVELEKATTNLRDSENGLAQMREQAHSLAQQVQDYQGTIIELRKAIQAQEGLAASQDALEKQATVTTLQARVTHLLASLASERTQKDVGRASLNEKHAREIGELEEQVGKLQADVNSKDVELREKIASATELVYDKWAAISQGKQVEWEKKLQETEARLNTEITKEREKAEVAEEQLAGIHRESAQMQQLRAETESKLQTTIEEYSAKLVAMEQHDGAQIASLQTQLSSLQADHTALQAQLASQMQVDVDQQQIAKLQQESEERRQRVEFFKRNSEYLSRRIKDAESRNRSLEQSEGLKSKQIEELRRQVERVDRRFSKEMPPMPGAFA
jgi:chromosome segregation ATPase